jgi:hypothetical protein
VKTPFSNADFIRAHQLGNPRNPKLCAAVAERLRQHGYVQVNRGTHRVWILESERGGLADGIIERIDEAIISAG